MASSRPSILLRGLGAVAHLLQGGWTEADTFSVPVPSRRLRLLGAQVFQELLAEAGKLILFACVEVGSRG